LEEILVLNQDRKSKTTNRLREDWGRRIDENVSANEEDRGQIRGAILGTSKLSDHDGYGVGNKSNRRRSHLI